MTQATYQICSEKADLPDGRALNWMRVSWERKKIKYIWGCFSLQGNATVVDHSGLEGLFGREYDRYAEYAKKLPQGQKLSSFFQEIYPKIPEQNIPNLFWGLMESEYLMGRFDPSIARQRFIDDCIGGVVAYYTGLKHPVLLELDNPSLHQDLAGAAKKYCEAIVKGKEDAYLILLGTEFKEGVKQFFRAVAEGEQNPSLIFSETNYYSTEECSTFAILSALFWDLLRKEGYDEKKILLSSEEARKEIAQAIFQKLNER